MTPRARRRGARQGVPAAVVVAALLGCIELSTDPNVPFALEFDSIPYPALLAGDTMRDSLGVAAPLKALAYNSSGDVIAGAPITYFALDSGIAISLSGILTTTRRDGSVRVVASVGGLQTDERTIQVARRPDTLFTEQALGTTFSYALPDVAANLTPELRVRVQTKDLLGGLSANVPGWVVRWRAVHAGDTLAPEDTAIVTLQSAAGRRSGRDTTATDGSSVRRLRVWANRLVAPVDSFVIVAEVKLHGVAVPGSPVLFRVKVVPP